MATVLTDEQVERDQRALLAGLDLICAKPIIWGETDCGAFPANIHVAAGRPDFYWRQRGKYKTAEELKALLGPLGLYRGLMRVAKEQGWVQIAPEHARLMDIGIVRTPDGHACVIRGIKNWLAPVGYGFAEVVDDGVLRAWSVS